jgi:hypothetical protein
VEILDLIDWTIETAKELRTPNDLTTIAPAIGGDAVLNSDHRLPISGASTDTDTDLITERLVIERPAAPVSGEPAAHLFIEPSAYASDELFVVEPEPAPPELAVPAPDAHSALLQAIVDPGIYTSKADRYRAIDLRWILRDIASDRLRTSPIGELDLQILIDMKLVELRGGVPHLTNAAVTAII